MEIPVGTVARSRGTGLGTCAELVRNAESTDGNDLRLRQGQLSSYGNWQVRRTLVRAFWRIGGQNRRNCKTNRELRYYKMLLISRRAH